MVLAMCSAKIAPRRPRAGDVFRLPRVLPGVLLAAAVFGAAALSGCGTTDDRPATWAFISTAIMEPGCATANCHSELAQRAEVNLSTRAAGYASLTTRHFVITDADGMLATPPLTPDERVDRSEIMHLMRADGTLRMPPDAPLPEADIELISKWIANGAAND